jgi:hypothetical protein
MAIMDSASQMQTVGSRSSIRETSFCPGNATGPIGRGASLDPPKATQIICCEHDRRGRKASMVNLAARAAHRLQRYNKSPTNRNGFDTNSDEHRVSSFRLQEFGNRLVLFSSFVKD